MKASSVFFVSGALIFALGGALLGSALLTSEPPPKTVTKVVPKKPNYRAVLVASNTLRPGDFMNATSIEWRAADKQYPEDAFFLKGLDEKSQLYGATVTQPIPAGTELESDLLVSPGEPGFIASVLKPGMRAVAIPADVVTSNAGLISGGDRVDVILSLKRDYEQGADNNPLATIKLPKLASQTLLRNVRVLSLNGTLDAFREKVQKVESKKEKKTDSNKRKSYETVTLEVLPKDVERLTVAREVGILQLALRSVQGQDLALSTSPEKDSKKSQSEVTTLGQVTDIYDSFKPMEDDDMTSVLMFRGEEQDTAEFMN
ncbi:Flp pilus assembly protein CpaB [Marinomonas mediterranea]|uniref:Flp pilus assembly protein CpaB n=1 Tax=Marinomonas mediterranea TaxID=119864 RepID=UPI00234A290C|nr:Flp pilus assembly protein CpaB [Marinomonas mediterranea]WCN11200.1 Flp pilus assembly protein CpaB [Marinomonas mediterranea]